MICSLLFGLVLLLSACGKKEKTDVLVVGTEAGFAPYEYLQGDQVVGVDIDIAKEIAKQNGKKLVIKNMDFDGALIALQQGKIDFVAAALSVSKERKRVMDFSDFYSTAKTVVIVNRKQPAIREASDLKGKIIGVQQGNTADLWISDQQNGEEKEIRRYTKFVQAIKDLENKKIDGILMDEIPAKQLIAKEKQKFQIAKGSLFEDHYAMAVKKGNQAVLQQINQTIQTLIKEKKIDEFLQTHMKP